MNIILKSFDGPFHRIIAEEALRGWTVGTCINIINYEQYMPQIHADQNIWMPAGPLRKGQYSNVDWATITPLDEELIKKMYSCEMVFLSMLERYALHGDIPYEERKRQYFDHLRYWNHTLEHESISLYLMNHAPHQCFDLVIYELCKLKGIPTYHLERCYSVEGALAVEDFEKSSPDLLPTFHKLQEEYADEQKPILLSPSYENFYQSQTSEEDSSPWFAISRDKHLKKKGFLLKWIGKSIDLLRRNPKYFAKAFLSPHVWMRKFSQHKTVQFYDAKAVKPDLSKPFIYAPLQMQPEEGMSPRGGAFENQELIIQLIAACAPSGVQIYVKEHPNQGEMFRSEEYYQSILSIPQVTFVPRTFDTYELIRHSKAVATGTGTAGFEGLFRGKPFLMFGHRWCQYAPGVYMIRTKDDCLCAMESIFAKGETPSLRDLRLYLRAIEQCSVPFEGGPIPSEERALEVGTMLHQKLSPLLQ